MVLAAVLAIYFSITCDLLIRCLSIDRESGLLAGIHGKTVQHFLRLAAGRDGKESGGFTGGLPGSAGGDASQPHRAVHRSRGAAGGEPLFPR